MNPTIKGYVNLTKSSEEFKMGFHFELNHNSNVIKIYYSEGI